MFARPDENLGRLALRDKMIVAELGSGTGFYVLAMAEILKREHIKDAVIYAIDVQKSLLERLRSDASRKGYTNVETIWGDFEVAGGTKLADKSVDVIVLANVLFQVDDKISLVRELSRILKSSGEVLVVDWSGSFGQMGPDLAHVISLSDARELFISSGFKEKSDWTAGAHHWGMLLKSQ